MGKLPELYTLTSLQKMNGLTFQNITFHASFTEGIKSGRGLSIQYISEKALPGNEWVFSTQGNKKGVNGQCSKLGFILMSRRRMANLRLLSSFCL